MSKKTFTAAPKPRQLTAEEIEAYEKNGTGHDRQALPIAAGTGCCDRRAEPSGSALICRQAFNAIQDRLQRDRAQDGQARLQSFIERRIAELEAKQESPANE